MLARSYFTTADMSGLDEYDYLIYPGFMRRPMARWNEDGSVAPMMRACMPLARLTLQGYQDPALPEGCLQEQDVERWILDLYPSITNRSAFAHDSPEFLAVYIAAASRAFFFFLDPRRQGTVQISTLVESPITDALLEVTLTAVSE